MNICFNCGIYRADKIIDPDGPYAICPECGYKHPFKQLPLLVVSGASGVGKSTVLHQLVGTINYAVLLDSDILWRDEFNQPESKYCNFFETWLRVCKNISQSGLPVVLFGAGMGVPENIEQCVERRYFSDIHYLALVCEDVLLSERLRSRPNWRLKGDPEYIKTHIGFNNWFKENHDKVSPSIDLFNTTGISVQETSDKIAAWIYRKLQLK
ncbi:nucleoside kinase [Chloroflexota bacterium]